MKIGIVTSEPNSWHTTQLTKALNTKNVKNSVIPITRLIGKISDRPYVISQAEPLETYDILLIRTIPRGSLEQIIFRMDVFHRLEQLGVTVVNPASTIEKSVDKYYTLSLLEDAGLPIPRTIVTEEFHDALEAFHELGQDVIVKPLFGSCGTGIVRITDYDIAYRVFRSLEMARNIFYLQEFIPHRQQDIRVFVIGDEIIGSELRKGDSWKTNVAQGAEPHFYEPDQKIVDFSMKATDVLNCYYTGVDFLQSENDGKYYLLELNSAPTWKGLQSVLHKNVAEELVDYLVQL